MLALTYAIAITAAVTTAAAAEPRILSKSPLVLKAVKTERCLPLGKPVSSFTIASTNLKCRIARSIRNIFVYLPVSDVEASLLHADIPKHLHGVRHGTDHVLQVRKGNLPSESEHQKLDKLQQDSCAAKCHQLQGTQDRVLEFYSCFIRLCTVIKRLNAVSHSRVYLPVLMNLNLFLDVRD